MCKPQQQSYPTFHNYRPLLFYVNYTGWLPVNSRIIFKLACLTYKLLTTSQPAYLHMLLHHYTPTRTLQLTNQFFLDMPRFSTEFGKRSFSYLTMSAASCNGRVHLFVCLSALSVTKLQKRDFLKN